MNTRSNIPRISRRKRNTQKNLYPRREIISIIYLIVHILIILFCIYEIKDVNKVSNINNPPAKTQVVPSDKAPTVEQTNTKDYRKRQADYTIVMSFLITLSFIILLCLLFGWVNFKNGVFDFIIGDNGTYSLSRLQAVLWAIVIISYQIEVIITLILDKGNDGFYYYQPVFSESSVMLLGLSLSSYIAVKGITVNQLTKNPEQYKRKTKPQWRDILVGDNGLDFSRCQMLIWTIIAIVVFISKCYFFIYHLIGADHNTITDMFNNMYDEYDSNNIPKTTTPFVPYLPWTFVVLMGLSQGVYVGKKLVPTFKLDDVKEDKQVELQNTIQQLTVKQALLNSIITKTAANSLTAMDKFNIQAIKQEIANTQKKIQDIRKDIQDIDAYKN